MKKAHLFATAAAILFASSAYAQTGTRETFRPTNACQGCVIDDVSTRPADRSNPNTFTNPMPTDATIDNCSVVVQEGTSTSAATGNHADVEQLGKNNRAGLYQQQGTGNYGLQTQEGNGNRAKAIVWGNKNTTLQTQKGDRNKAGINVDQIVNQSNPPVANANGDRNWVQQNQAGDNNLADIKTYGNDNIDSQDQQGSRNSGSIFQRTNNSVASQSQIGNDNTAVTTQGGTLNQASSVKFQRSCIEQTGAFNQALVKQNN